MSGNLNISNLSYKELQALALRYRVPGNIKKHLLIEVLQAARCGNEQEVDKLLADLRQNRKKRIRKNKPTKLTMSIASTPIHSPTYDMADDYYAVQHRLPYQWVGAEEEIPNRQLDEVNRVPHYEEFRQFLLRRIQRDYQTYSTNHNEKIDPGDPGSIMDLRNDQGDSVQFETNNTTVGVKSNSIAPMNSLESVQIAHNPSSATFDYQILQDPNGNGNNNASILLRRMLQAPVGADLGVIASPELGSSCRIWGNDHYNQNENNLLDNSDTVSANSDVNGNDNDTDDNNWPIGTEYYRFVNNMRDQLILNSGNRQNFDQPGTAGQFCSVLTDNNPLQYQLLYANQMPDVQHQHGQQQWETSGPFDTDVLNYHQKPRTFQSSKIFPPGTNAYYDGISATNFTTTRIPENSNLQQQPYVNEDGSGYSTGNQIGFEDNTGSCTAAPYPRSEMKFYENLNNNNSNTDGANAIVDAFSSIENSGRQMNDPNDYTLAKPHIHQTHYYPSPGDPLQHTPEFMPPMEHSSLSHSHTQQGVPPPLAHNGYVENLGCTPSSIQTQVQTPQILEEFNRPSIFAQYSTSQKANSLVDENQELEYQPTGSQNEIGGGEIEGGIDAEAKMIFGSTSTTQPDSTVSLDAFWPKRSVARGATNNCLENILNLNTHGYGYVDFSKVDQTSCIYCYSAPIVTQKLYTGNSPCSQKKRLIAEFRKHTFSPHWLLYKDANTSMRLLRQGMTALDKIQKPSLIEKPSAEMIMTDSVKGMTDIAVDLVNEENALETQDRPINNDSEFLLPDEQHLNLKITEEANGTDECHGKKLFAFDSDLQPTPKSGAPSSTVDFNDQDEAKPSENLNMGNVNC